LLALPQLRERMTRSKQRAGASVRPVWITVLILGLVTLWSGCSDALLSPEVELSRLDLQPVDSLVTQGDTVQVNVLAYGEDGNRIDDKPGWTASSVVYISDNAEVMAIENGVPVATGGGETVLRGALGDLSGSTAIRVNPVELDVTVDAEIVQSDVSYDDSGKLEPYTPASVSVTVKAEQENFFRPPVELLIYNSGTLETTIRKEAPGRIRTGDDADDASNRWEVDLPGEYVREGLELSVRLDPDDSLPATSSSVLSFPADGTRLPVDVRTLQFVQVEGFHVTQSTQRLDGSIPLVAERDGLIRVFLRGDPGANDPSFRPNVRAIFYENGSVIETIDISGTGPIPPSINRADFDASWNGIVPGSLLRPGVSVQLVAVPEQPVTPGDPRMYPRDGDPEALDVEDVPRFDITLVPVEYEPTGSRGNVDPSNAELFLSELRQMAPLSDIDWEVRTPFVTSTAPTSFENWSSILSDMRALQLDDGRGRYFYGVLPSDVTQNYGGLGYVPGRAAIGYDRLPFGIGVLAHELGHNFGRSHSPCGDPGNPDANYPYSRADIGVPGYNVETGEYFASVTQDFMSYCNPVWISDYSYEGILDYRRATEGRRLQKQAADEVLLIRGTLSPDAVTLDAAFPITARPVRPSESGPYVLEGRDARGQTLFAKRFDGEAISHLPDGYSNFVFALPTREIELNRLASLHVRGNGHSASLQATGAAKSASDPQVSLMPDRSGTQLSWDADRYPDVLVRDAASGDILTFGRDGRVFVPTTTALEVTFSDGISTVTRRVQP